jgi:cytochrome oxidase assembly protein ShyY1
VRAGKYHQVVTTAHGWRQLPWRRISAAAAVTLLISGVCITAGIWQWNRHDARSAAAEASAIAQSQPPAPIGDMVPPGVEMLPPGAEWRRITANGTIDPSSVTVLRNRTIDGTKTWQYLGWLEATDGTALAVNLGWIAETGPNDSPPPLTHDAAAEWTVEGTLRTWEPDDGQRADTATRISPEQLASPLREAVPGYATVQQACTASACAGAYPGLMQTPLPTLSLGPHLAYAFQWWTFAILAPLGAVMLLKRDVHDATGSPTPRAARGTTRRSVGDLTDEEIEDALTST